MRIYVSLLCVLFPLALSAKNGTTVFRFKTKPPRESHFLVINEGEKTEATYIGSQHVGDKDVQFYKSALTDFVKKENGEISFTIGKRELCKKPFKPNGKEKPQVCDASSEELLTYKGSLTNDELHLTCQSLHGDCWGDDFFFKRGTR